MILKKLNIVQKLRKEREKRCEAELLASRNHLKACEVKLRSANRLIQIREVIRRSQETQIYGDIIGKSITAKELDLLQHQIDRFRAETEVLNEKAASALSDKENASEEVAKIQTNLARLHRSRAKWDELKSIAVKKALVEQERGEDAAFEDMFVVKPVPATSG